MWKTKISETHEYLSDLFEDTKDRLALSPLKNLHPYVEKAADWFASLPRDRVRLGMWCGVAIIALSEIATILQPLLIQNAYALGSAASLLPTASPYMAEKLQFDTREQVFNFNNGQTQATNPESVGAAVRASVVAHKDPAKGLTVTDPIKKIDFSMTPKFGLETGRQDGDRIVYPLLGGAGWVVYTMRGTGVKEDIILNHATTDTVSYSFALQKGNGTEAKIEKDGSIGIYGNSILAGDVSTSSDKDTALLKEARQNAPKDTLLFSIPRPVVIETGKKQSDVKANFTLEGNTLTVTATGLKNAHYPLSIDPSIYVETAEKFMRGNNEANIDFDVDNTLIQKGKTTGARFDALTATTSLPASRWNHATAVAGGHIYTVGGNNGTSNQSTVYWAKFNTSTSAIDSPNPGNGACSGWCTDSAYNLPATREALSLVAYNGYLFAVGGEDSSCTTGNGTGNNGICDTVYTAKIGANGEPQLWHPTDTDKSNWVYWYRDTDLSTPRSHSAAVAYNSNLYLLGGKTDAAAGGVTTVEYASLNPQGTLNSWTSTGMTALPSVRFGHDAEVYNDRLYLIGGNSNGTLQDSVNYIKINSDGTMASSWSSANTFTTARMSWGGGFAAISGGYLYISGGCAAIDAEGECTSAGITNGGNPVELASINADGSLGFWGSITNVTNARIGYGLVAWRNSLYTIGGCTAQNTTTGACTTTSSATSYGTVNQDGDGSTVGTSQASGTAPCNGGDPTNCDLPGTSHIGNMLSSTAIMNGYLYIIGGCTSNDCSTASGNTMYAAIDADGKLRRPASCAGGSIVDSFCVDSADPISGGVAAAGSAVFGGRIYVVGGQNGAGLKGNIYSVGVNNDGSLGGAWTAQTFSNLGATSVSYTYAYARANPASAGTYPGSLYIFGGCSATTGGVGCTANSYTQNVYKCNIETTGLLEEDDANQCTTTNQLQIGTVPGASGTGLALHAGTVYANYIYLVGGVAPGLAGLDSIRFAKFDNSNNVVAASGSAWTEPTDSGGSPVEMSTGRQRGAAFGYNGYLYTMGGYDAGGSGTLSDIQFAKINVSTGHLEQFNVSAVTINQRWGLSVPVSNSYAYVIGGCTTGNAPTCTARTNTVQTFQIYNNDSGAPANYSSAANLFPTDRFGAGATILNGYMYVAGGCVAVLSCNNATNSVAYAPLNADGTIGTWSTTTALPADRVFGQLETAGGSLYFIGGTDDSETAQSAVYYATPNSDGTITSWSTASGGIGDTSGQAAVARSEFGATVWNNRIYVVGGFDASSNSTSTVYVSPQLNSGGNIAADSWSASTSINVARNGATAVAYANNLYVLGGHDSQNYLSDVQYTQINSDGTLDSWGYSTSLPRNISHADGFAANGYMYIFGGKQSDILCTSNTYVAPISANTTIASGNNPTGLGEWFLTNERFSAERSNVAAVYHQGKAYLAGGSCGTLEGGGGTVVMQDDFDANIDNTMWTSTTNMSVGTTCGTVSSGNSLYSLGNSTAQPITKDVDVQYGGTVSFWLKIPTSDIGSCEAPQAGEDLVLQYSNNGGSGWTTIATYNESNFNTPTQITESIPSGAWTSTTRFRWYIPNADNNRDEWAIDNIVVTANNTPPVRQLMEDDFDATIDAPDWSNTTGMNVGTTCGTIGSGNSLVSGGGASAAITQDQNMQYGGQVVFKLRIPTNSGGGCSQPAAGENVELQYSTNGGSNWTAFATYDAALYNTPTALTIAIPPAAYSSAVRFRFIMPNGDAGVDQWAIDDVVTNAFEPILTYTGIHRVVTTSLLSQPQIAKYSIMFDTDTDVFPTNWLLNGVDNSIGAKWNLTYRSMTNPGASIQCAASSMSTWGQETNFSDVTLGTPGIYTPKDGSGANTNCARFFFFSVAVDSTRAYGYPDDVTRGPTIADLTLQFTANPAKRLMHGRTFTGGLQQPIDTPYYSN